jgi:hypothetical protein
MNPFISNKNDKFYNIKKTFRESKIYLYPYARIALYYLLETIKSENDKSIYVPKFICRDLLSPMNILKFKIQFYEIDKKLNAKLDFNLRSDIVIMVNYFGFPQNISPFIEYKKKFNSILIEDNAHGLFSRDDGGTLLGTRGDFGLLSIRKSIFLPNGAALLINNRNFFNIQFESAPFKETLEDSNYKKKLYLKKVFRFLGYHAGIKFLKLRRFLRKIRTKSEIPLPCPTSEKELPDNHYLTPMLKNGELNCDINYEIKRRQTMFQLVLDYSKDFNIKPVFHNFTDNVSPYAFPFYAEKKDAKKFEKFLFKKGFYILPWPDLPGKIEEDCQDFYKKTWMVPFLW